MYSNILGFVLKTITVTLSECERGRGRARERERERLLARGGSTLIKKW